MNTKKKSYLVLSREPNNEEWNVSKLKEVLGLIKTKKGKYPLKNQYF